MEVGFLSTLAFGFILGIKHAVEPDHVVAVSTIASQSKKVWGSALSGVFWGIGHTATLFIVGMALILMKGEIPDVWALSLEFLVGIMLVYLGITSIFFSKNIQLHKNVDVHRYKNIAYVKSLLIGFVHGLAGSAAITLLTLSTATSVLEGSIYILVFGAGTVIGMLFFTTILGIPFVLTAKNVNINKYLIQITGVISIVFGFYYIYDLGVTEGLFLLWLR